MLDSKMVRNAGVDKLMVITVSLKKPNAIPSAALTNMSFVEAVPSTVFMIWPFTKDLVAALIHQRTVPIWEELTWEIHADKLAKQTLKNKIAWEYAEPVLKTQLQRNIRTA
jgi:hypothetical protein